MSEYQYYEFVAIDRPLTNEQQRELRAITSRATITSTRLVNEYHYGDFKGDPLELLEHYFDAHLYYANWGTRIIMFAFPQAQVDEEALAAYSDDEYCRVITRGDRVIVELTEQDDDLELEYDAEPSLAALLPLRDDIIAGDLRSLYLASLKGLGIWIDEEELDDETAVEVNLEPPLPAGLQQLSAPLEALIELLDVDRDLVAVAAEASPPLFVSDPSLLELQAWIKRLPESEKDALLIRLVHGELNLANELRRRLRSELQAGLPAARGRPRRQVAELFGRAERRREERLQAEAARREAEAARLREESARQRATYLARLRGQEPNLWRQVDALASTKKPTDYDRAVTLLRDLRDLAQESDLREQFREQLVLFRSAHSRKPSLIQRLDKAGLR